MELYPLKFTPILKQKLWGGTRLKTILNKTIPSDHTGESWELSGLPGAISEVSNGVLAGTSLQTLLTQAGERLLGQSVLKQFGTHFPILVKFIDAQQDLSIQLHPNDTLAQKRHNSPGKTEMWYVIDADPEAKLITGFNKQITQKAYVENLEQGKLLNMLHYENATAGDAFFIPSGTIHAIGSGILIAEIQQTSDITYRVFDFDRKDENGQCRTLHTDWALDALDYTATKNTKIPYSRTQNQANKMVHCPYFSTHFLELTQPMECNIATRDSFTIYICVDGHAVITNDWGSTPIQKGETVLIAAESRNLTIDTQGSAFLEVTL